MYTVDGLALAVVTEMWSLLWVHFFGSEVFGVRDISVEFVLVFLPILSFEIIISELHTIPWRVFSS